VEIEGCLEFTALQLEDDQTLHTQEPDEFSLPDCKERASYASGLLDPGLVAWRPPSEWDIVLPRSPDDDQGKELPPVPAQEETAVAQRSPEELTRFQRFIRRMESAGPKIILDRLKEEWTNPVDSEMGEEMALEKQLWVLTAFQLENIGRYSRFPKSDTGKILELYGNLCK
jgi:hypothetical protein